MRQNVDHTSMPLHYMLFNKGNIEGTRSSEIGV